MRQEQGSERGHADIIADERRTRPSGVALTMAHMTLPQLVDVLFHRQWRVLVGVFVAAVAAAALVTFTLADEYESAATLFVGENRPISAGANAVQLDEVLAQTYAELLSTSEVTRAVAGALPFPLEPGDIDDRMSFEVLTGTNLIEVRATGPAPERAQVLANTYAEVFVDRQRQRAQEDSRQTLARLQERIGEIAGEIDRREQQTGTASRLARLNSELQGLETSYQTTQENVALQANTIAVSTRAAEPASPARPRPRLYLAAATLIAAALAVGAALLRNAFDRRVRDEKELSELIDSPVLGRIPATGRSGRFEEAMQFLAANVGFARSEPTRSIAVTSPLPSDGKTTVAAGLGEALARTGAKVITVDCDLRRPRLSEELGVEAGQGLTNVLVGGLDPVKLLKPVGKPGLRTLPAGPLPPNPAVLLGTAAFGRMLERLEQEADYVILDLPPATVGAETLEAISAVDATLLVVELRRLRRDALATAREQIERAGVDLVGIVLNRVSDTVGEYSYYGYGGGRSQGEAGDGDGDDGRRGRVNRLRPANRPGRDTERSAPRRAQP